MQISGNTVTVNPNVDLAPGFITESVPGVTLTGNGRANTLAGGAGDDTIAGLGGKDALTGAGGFDTFAYTAVTHSTSSGYDTISDFNAEFDQFDL